jgi:hypothetical protein
MPHFFILYTSFVQHAIYHIFCAGLLFCASAFVGIFMLYKIFEAGIVSQFAVQLLAFNSLSSYYFYVPEAYIMYMMSPKIWNQYLQDNC